MTVNNHNDEDQGLNRTGSSEVVVGLFQSGEDAHRAIVQLQAEGFSASQIGAAFRSTSTGVGTRDSESASRVAGKEVAPLQSAGTTGAGSGSTGPRSDTTTVTPTGLSTGSGTPNAGLGRPIPEIPSSAVPSPGTTPPTTRMEYTGSMAESARSEFADTGVGATPVSMAAERASDPTPARQYSGSDYSLNRDVASSGERHHAEGEGWWEKLKHIFGGGEDEKTSYRNEQAEMKSKESKKFGTGEGDLRLDELAASASRSNAFDYSDLHFEQSFTGMGIPMERARYLARELGRGGAIVTVRAGLRVTEAERTLEQNHASIRHEGQQNTAAASSAMPPYPGQVEVFGEVERAYPRRDDSADFKGRKAS